MGDILRVMEGSLEPVKCAAIDSEDGCIAAGGCVTKYVWQKINESIARTVDEMNLKELVQESQRINPEGDYTNHMCG